MIKLIQILMPICFCLNIWFLTEAFIAQDHGQVLIYAIGAAASVYSVYRYAGEE